jgi:hypothetical protein
MQAPSLGHEWGAEFRRGSIARLFLSQVYTQALGSSHHDDPFC